MHLSWRAVGQLVVQGSNQILITPAPGADEEALRLFVVGAGFGVLLHQRGFLVLHGSAVIIDGECRRLPWRKGLGKVDDGRGATAARACRFISDELLVIRFEGENGAQVMPGSSPIKLWSDALVSVGGNPDTSVPVRPGHPKYFVSESTITEGEFPLRTLFLLDVGDTLAVAEVPPAAAFFSVAPHVYVCRFGTGFLQATGADRTFRQLSLLLKRTSVMRLYRQRDLSQLSEIARLVEVHSPE